MALRETLPIQPGDWETVSQYLAQIPKQFSVMDPAYGAIGDGVANDGPAIAAAISAASLVGGVVWFPAGQYKVNSTIRLKSNVTLRGQTIGDNNGLAATIKANFNDGSPLFDTASGAANSYLSACIVEDLGFKGPVSPGSTLNNSPCFSIVAAINVVSFRRCFIQNFSGDAFKFVTNPSGTDTTSAAVSTVFDHCFIVGCGGYAFNINGNPVATIRMCDVNSCSGGYLHVQNATGNQGSLVLIEPWWEGTQSWSAVNPILLENMAGTPVVVIGGTFNGTGVASTDVAKVQTTSSCAVSFVGSSMAGFTNAINDTFSSFTYPAATNTTYLSGTAAMGAANFRGASPLVEWFNAGAGGTVNHRRWRIYEAGGGSLIMDTRNDAGSLGVVGWVFDHTTGIFRYANPVILGSSTSTDPFDTQGTGSPEGVVTAPVGSVYRRKNGSAATSLYVKESGTGNTGWIPYAGPSRIDLALTARGLITEAYPLSAITAAAALGATGANSTLNGAMVGLRAGDVVAKVSMLVAAIGSSVTLTKFGLFDSAGTLLGVTADLTGSLVVNSFLTGTLTAPFTVLTSGGYYVAALTIASVTQPTFYRAVSATGAGKQIGAGARMGISVAAQTDIAGNVTPANGDTHFWFGVS